MPAANPPNSNRLSPSAWQARAAAHQRRVGPWVTARQARTSRGEKHPVYDFLFEYYSHRPSLLHRWSPGFGTILEGDETNHFLRRPEFGRIDGGVGLAAERIDARLRERATWIGELLRRCRDRPARFACYGLHEWAMVYESETVRHADWPLRFPRNDIRRIVESRPLCCTHYDAFRFFTPQARPLNRWQPGKENRLDLEQSGCLHTNMDLYKWAYKLAPWAPSELVADTFELAAEIRETDMRASPYDLAALGFPPIPVETSAGREEYAARQRDFHRRAAPLRDRLIALCEKLISTRIPGLS